MSALFIDSSETACNPLIPIRCLFPVTLRDSKFVCYLCRRSLVVGCENRLFGLIDQILRFHKFELTRLKKNNISFKDLIDQAGVGFNLA